MPRLSGGKRSSPEAGGIERLFRAGGDMRTVAELAADIGDRQTAVEGLTTLSTTSMSPSTIPSPASSRLRHSRRRSPRDGARRGGFRSNELWRKSSAGDGKPACTVLPVIGISSARQLRDGRSSGISECGDSCCVFRSPRQKPFRRKDEKERTRLRAPRCMSAWMITPRR